MKTAALFISIGLLALDQSSLASTPGATRPSLAPTSQPAGPQTQSVPPEYTHAFKTGRILYSYWGPEDVKAYKTVFVIMGKGGGKSVAKDPAWRQAAKRLSSAVLLCEADGGKFYDYWHQNGGVREIVDALRELAGRTGHAELPNAPWVLWGHSGGAMCANYLANLTPQRVAAVIPYHGVTYDRYLYFKEQPGTKMVEGVGVLYDIPAEACRIPALYFIGERDMGIIATPARRQFVKDRQNGALRALVVQPGVDHGSVTGHPFTLAWLEAVLARRLPEKADAAKGPIELRTIRESDGWLGDNETGAISPSDDYKGDKAKASWLPDEATAKAWQQVIKPNASKRPS